MAETDKACCSLPAVVAQDYKPTGSHIQLAGINVYITGSTTSKRALIAIYDVFAYVSQTLQGADRMASSMNALVLMPDFFDGEPLPVNIYPPDTKEKKNLVEDWRQKRGDFSMNVPKLLEVVREAKTKYPQVEGWGAYGLCWGGKITALASGPDTPFRAAGTAHPGRLVKEEAEAITIPFICLFSKEDATPELVEEYTKALEAKEQNMVEKYDTMHHGWMSARADLQNEANVRAFEKGYNQLSSFFMKHL